MNPEAAPEFNTLFDRIAGWIENTLLCLLLALMVGVSATQIILREFYSTGFVWADEFLRLLVLWLALVGGVSAARVDRHLKIDALHRVLKARGRGVLACAASLSVIVLAAFFAWASLRFVIDAKTYEDTVFGQTPAWPFLTIMPIALALVALLYLRHAWHGLRLFIDGGDE